MDSGVFDAVAAPRKGGVDQVAEASDARLTRATSDESMQQLEYRTHDIDDARELIRDDIFERARTDEELMAIVQQCEDVTSTPYAEIVRRMLGMAQLDEDEAKSLFQSVIEHRRRLSRALGRDVHVRVAGLDLITIRRSRGQSTHPRPIVVTPNLIERALEEASADAVTGLPQRNHFMGLLRHELRQRSRRDVAVVFIDLDGFKEVNDTFGHAAGDEVLRTLARSAKVTLRHGDVIARMGGDEFALLLLDVTEDEARIAVERLRTRFESRTERYKTSFSAGIVLADANDTPEGVLVRADAGMYQDKRARHAKADGAR